MKAGKFLLGTGAIVAVTAGLVGVVWLIALDSVRTAQDQVRARVDAVLAGQVLAASSQVDRQITAVDQMLSQMARAWREKPAGIDPAELLRQASTVEGVARDVILADAGGTIRQSTLPDALGQSVAGQDFFVALSDRLNRTDTLFLGAAAINPILRQWHINAARALRNDDGTFAGAIDADYRISAITGILDQAALGAGGIAFVVGLNDGKLRGLVGAAQIDPDTPLNDMPLLGVIKAAGSGIWLGRSPIDAAMRIHAFRQLPRRDLAVVVAMDEQEALAQVRAWKWQAIGFAAAITAALLAIAWLLAGRGRIAAATAEARRQHQEALAYASAQTEVFRAVGAARTEQLEATLAGAAEGICIVDAHLCLAEWNERFADLAGIPPDALRAGMPLEEVLRAQIDAGGLGPVEDVAAAVAQRMARLRSGSEVTVRRAHADGRMLEIRRKAGPDGGFVSFYTDISAAARGEENLRAAHAAAAQAEATRQHLIAAVVAEIQSSAAALREAVERLSETPLSGDQQRILGSARRAGERLAGVAGDVAETRRIEAGRVAVRPTLFDLRTLLDDIVGQCSGDAAAAGIGLRAVVSPALPATLYADAAILRQLLRSLADFAIATARDTEVVLEAQPGRGSPAEGLLLLVRTDRSTLEPTRMRRLFDAATAVGDEPAAALDGTLALTLSRRLATLLKAGIGCEPQPGMESEGGHHIWVSLPPQVLPIRSLAESRTAAVTASPAQQPLSASRLPRTRVLLVEDNPAGQVVTATLLRRDGHMVDVAATVAEAEVVIADTPYDLIFVDTALRGKGGPAALAALRGLTRAARSLPVVALTAEPSPEDVDRIKQAGCQDVLGKPVERADLLAALSRCVWYRHAEPSARKRPAQAVDDTQPAPNVLATDRLQELRGNLSPETFVTLVEECLTDLEGQIPALRLALMGDAPGPVVAHAHAMVGMASGYGMASLEAALRSILNAARAEDRSGLGPDAMARVEAALADTSRALREMMQDVLA